MIRKYKIKREADCENVYVEALTLVKQSGWTWNSCGAIFGLGGAFLSTVVMIASSVAAWWLKLSNAALIAKTVGFSSLMLILPLLGLGAHCLDLLEKKSPALSAAKLRSNITFDFDPNLQNAPRLDSRDMGLKK